MHYVTWVLFGPTEIFIHFQTLDLVCHSNIKKNSPGKAKTHWHELHFKVLSNL